MVLSESISQRLSQGAQAMEMALSDDEQQRLLTYLAALIKWNKAYNLTAIRDPLEMVDKHLLDSLSILPHIDESPLIDIGTGAGLPGMIIAIMRPQLAVTLLDSNGKKTRFLKQVAADMALPQITVVNDRCEQHIGQYGQIASRAFASLSDMVNGTEHLMAPNGRWLAMKGHVPDDEISALASTIRVETTPALRVPFRADARHLIILRRD